MRRFGDLPDPGVSYVHRPGAYAILPIAGHVLLTRQTQPTDELQLPGGGIDPGESPLAALHREVIEETGWRIGAPRRIGIYRRFVYMPDYGFHAEKICHIFVARPTLRLAQPTEPHHTPVFIPRARTAAALANPGDRMIARRYLQSVG